MKMVCKQQNSAFSLRSSVCRCCKKHLIYFKTPSVFRCIRYFSDSNSHEWGTPLGEYGRAGIIV